MSAASEGRLVQRVCRMYAYHGELGTEVHKLGRGYALRNTEHPQVWSSNKAYSISASTAREYSDLQAELDELFDGTPIAMLWSIR